MCKKPGAAKDVITYFACPKAPATVAAVAATNDAHLYNCAICVNKVHTPVTGPTHTSRYCQKCMPGMIEMMGGCFKLTEGEKTTSALCKDCEDCRKFSGDHNAIDFRCAKCKQGYHMDKEGRGHCSEASKNHCNHVNGVSNNKLIGMEKVSGKEVCVDECPEGSVANL